MKISKKILALILSLSVILSGFSIMAQASETNVASTALSSNEFDALCAFGFLGEDIKILNNESVITRSQFVGSLFKVAGFTPAEYSSEELYFDDVTYETLYRNEIQYFYNAGLINGTGAKTFSPSNPITYKQAVKIILDILGFKGYIESHYEDVMNGYIAVAQKVELCQGFVIGNVDAPLTAQKAVKLLYNAGITGTFEPNYYESTGDINYNFEIPTITLFEKNHRLYYDEGLMQSNGFVSIISYDAPDKAAVINGVEYVLSDCDLTGLTGLQVQFFYKKDNGDDIIMWACASSKNNMIVLNATQLARDNPNYDIDTVVYKVGDRKTAKLEISPYANVIYNNTLVNNYTVDDIKPRIGRVTLVENNNDSKYDLVIVEEYRNAITTNVSNIGPHIANKYNEDLHLQDYDNIKVYENGKEIPVEAIGKETVITYIADRSKKNVVIYVNREVGTGKLIGSSVEDGVTTLEFEDGTYIYSPSYEDIDASKYQKVDPRIGKMYRYLLDREGNIADIIEQSDGILEYALLIRAAENEDAFAPDGSAYFRMLLTNGNYITAKNSKKMKLLTSSGKTPVTGMDIYNDARIWKDGIVGGTFEPIVVRITLNSEGEIAEWEFPYDNTQNQWGHHLGKFSLDAIVPSSDYKTQDGVYTLNSRYHLNNTVICFAKYDGVDLEEPYTIISHSALIPSGNVYVYDADQYHIPKVLMLTHTIGQIGRATTNIFFVDAVKYKKIDGEFVKHVCGYYGGVWTEVAEFSEGIIPADLKKGDIIKYVTYSNKIIKLDKYMNVLDATSPIYGSMNSNDVMMYSYLYSVGESNVTVLTPDDMVSTYGKLYSTGFSTNTIVPVMVYDARNDTMEVLRPIDVAPDKSPEADGYFEPASDSMMALINRKGLYAFDVLIVVR